MSRRWAPWSSNPSFVICSFVSFSTENTCILCKLNWIPFGSKCYFISTKTKTWNKSRDWCLTKGGQLVNIENSEEWVCHLCRWI
uniref:C-type lectin domain-containing protein n=1 Tax=Erpetoichthys calabaricus TaxID=27687 RepID=A0A8C4T7X8_ERPCA